MVTREDHRNDRQGKVAFALEETCVVVDNLYDAVRRSRKGVGQQAQTEFDQLCLRNRLGAG